MRNKTFGTAGWRTALLALAGLAGIFSVGTASSADLPAPVYKAAPPVQIYNWSGFYIGGHAAGAWSDVKNTGLTWGPGNYLAPGSIQALQNEQDSRLPFDFQQTGGGLQAGYNYQIGRAVFGIEADMTWFGGNGSTSVRSEAITAPGVFHTIGYTANVEWLATIRGRLGYAADRLFVYGTGGVAIADVNFAWSYRDTIGAALQLGAGAGSVHETRARAIFGGGFEYAFTDNFAVKFEYLYTPLGKISAAGVVQDIPLTGLSNTVTASADLDTHLVKFGLNYKFGAPVAAKY